VSELSAIDAPTRKVWLVLCTPYAPLTILFAIGIISVNPQNRALRTGGWFLLVYGILNILWVFAPMHQRPALAAGASSFSDTAHIALACATVLLFLLSLGTVALSLYRGFKIY
jgi:hypothetical protein